MKLLNLCYIYRFNLSNLYNYKVILNKNLLCILRFFKNVDCFSVKIDLLLESNSDEPIELPPANRFLRKLIYQTGKAKYDNLIHLETKSSDKDSRLSSIIATKVPTEDKLKELENAKLQEELVSIHRNIYIFFPGYFRIPNQHLFSRMNLIMLLDFQKSSK